MAPIIFIVDFYATSRDNLIIYASCSFLETCCFSERLSAFHAERNELFPLEIFLSSYFTIFSVHRFADSNQFHILVHVFVRTTMHVYVFVKIRTSWGTSLFGVHLSCIVIHHGIRGSTKYVFDECYALRFRKCRHSVVDTWSNTF